MRFKESEIPCWNFLDGRLIDLINLYENIQNNNNVINEFFKGLQPLSSQKQIELNEKLKKNINKEDSKFFLYEPEIDYDTTLISHIRYKLHLDKNNYEYDTLSLEYYLRLKNITDLDFSKDKIILINEDGKKYKEWSILKCLYGEMKIDNQVYILSNAMWYRVPQDKYDRINKNISEIIDDLQIDKSVKQNTTNEILKEKKEHKTHIRKEQIFNIELCKQISGELFDKNSKQIIIDGDKMEVCDIFDPSKKEFIHSKIGTKAATLSHLFNQGYVSARAYASMKELFVSKVNQKMDNPDHYLGHEQNSHQDYTIRYLIINDNVENKLTFISKLALDRIITNLRGFGYNVKLSWVNGINLYPSINA